MAADRTEMPVFVVSGQVFAYQNVNYLLPTLARMVTDSPGPGVPSAPAPRNPAAEPGVQELIKELEAQREAGRGPESVTRTETHPSEGASAGGAMIPEGQPLVRRRGRMVRTAAGEWSWTMDNAAQADAKLDRAMILLPCLTLQRMEATAAARGESGTFEVSGRVMAYQGRNYLLPTVFQVYPTTELEARH
jgi:hypothetical protein